MQKRKKKKIIEGNNLKRTTRSHEGLEQRSKYQKEAK